MVRNELLKMVDDLREGGDDQESGVNILRVAYPWNVLI